MFGTLMLLTKNVHIDHLKSVEKVLKVKFDNVLSRSLQFS